jgi:hypothetical protein
MIGLTHPQLWHIGLFILMLELTTKSFLGYVTIEIIGNRLQQTQSILETSQQQPIQETYHV